MAELGPYVYIDDEGKTDAERYLEGCLDGTYVVGRTIKRLAKKMLKEIAEGCKGRWHYDPELATRPVRWIEKFCKIPSAEKAGQPFILEPYERAIIELTFGFVDDEGVRRFREVFVMIGRKNGKALSLDTEIPTPNGWRLMRDIHPGDYVFGQDGKASEVLVESEIFHKPMYLVTFEDGSTIKASGDHIWTVQTKRSRSTVKRVPKSGRRVGVGKRYREDGWFETTTQEMFDDPSFLYRRADGKGTEYKYRVPMCAPVEYPEKDLPTDPYAFGYWLGDGNSQSARITVSTDDVDDAISILTAHGHTCVVRKSKNRADTIYIDVGTRGVAGSNPFKNALRELGVLGDKHIPDIYLQGSIKQRWELLCGLMDTDGYVSKAGQCQFVQKDRRLTEQFVELCSSLGIKANMSSKEARCNGKPAGTVYQVEFWTDKEHSCFSLPRKHERLKDNLAPRMSRKSITSIERIADEPSKCIAIDNESHLYLAGRQYTATHNTALCAALNLYMLTADNREAMGLEIINGATNMRQANLCFGATKDMAEMSPALSKRVRSGKVAKQGISGLNYDQKKNSLFTISGSPKSQDGYNMYFGVLDELAACKDNGSVYGLLKGSQNTPGSLLFIISTNGHVRNNIFDDRLNHAYRVLEGKEEDERFLPILYTLDDRSQWTDPACWVMTNPGLGTVKSIDAMTELVNQALNNPRSRNEVLTKQFNQPVEAYTSFLSIEECKNDATFTFDPKIDRYCCVGFDLADRGDLNCAVAMWMRPGDDHIYERCCGWIAEKQIEINSNLMKERDCLPYTVWSTQMCDRDPIINIAQGDKVNSRWIIDFLQELVNDGIYPVFIGYDGWHVDDWLERELAMFAGEANIRAIPQTARVLSPAMKEHQLDLRANRIVDNSNPLLITCRANVQSKVDAAGNYYPQKRDLRPNLRIDMYMAELFAYIQLKSNWDQFQSLIKP